MIAAPPTLGDVFLGVAGVVLGLLGAAITIRSGYRTGNWFAYVCALGCLAFAAGIVGQRTFPSTEAVQRLGSAAAATSIPGPWDAGVSLPVIAVRLTPVAVGGILVAAVGLSLLLLFERIPDPARLVWTEPRRLDDDDAV